MANNWNSTSPPEMLNATSSSSQVVKRDSSVQCVKPIVAIGQRGLSRHISNSNLPELLTTSVGPHSPHPSLPSPNPSGTSPRNTSGSSHSLTSSSFYGSQSTLSSLSSANLPPSPRSLNSRTDHDERLRGFFNPSSRSVKRRKNEDVIISYELSNGQSVSQRFSSNEIVKDVKDKMLDLIASAFPEEKLLDYSSYSLKIPGVDFFISDEKKNIHRLPTVQVCNKAYVPTHFQLVTYRDTGSDMDSIKQHILSELKTNQIIYTLLPDVLDNFLMYENDEIDSFRRSLARERIRIRTAIKESEMSEKYPQFTLDEPMPAHVPPKLVIACFLPIENETQIQIKADCSPEDWASDLLKKIFLKCSKQCPSVTTGKSPDDFILKVAGYHDFLYGSTKIGEYNYVRRCISKGLHNDIVLTLVPLSLKEESSEQKLFIVDQILSQEPEKKDEKSTVQMSTMTRPFKIKIVAAENAKVVPRDENEIIDPSHIHTFFVTAELYHSMNNIAEKPEFSSTSPYTSNMRWNQWLVFESMKICNISRGTKICFTLYRRTLAPSDPLLAQTWITGLDPMKDVPVGWANCQMIDYLDRLQTGHKSFRLWEGERANPIGTCVENLSSTTAPVLYVEFENFPQTVIYREDKTTLDRNLIFPEPSQGTQRILETIISKDPMAELTADEKRLVWDSRYWLTSKAEGLPKFLLSISWSEREQVLEAYKLLKIWKPPNAIQALELLDARFADPEVRSYAVSRLEESPVSAWADFLLQLTQVLKYEPHHDSDLARFLLRKSLLDRHRIGHAFFWHLKSEMHLAEIAERYGLLLEGYLRGCGEYHGELIVKEDESMRKLVGVANKIKKTPVNERLVILRSELGRLELPPQFQLPIDPTWQVNGLIVEKCKYMDSKKLPLWLVFTTEQVGKTITVIFKVGDDLRQDTLTLQMLRIMDKMWKKEGLDLLMQIYGCVSTGDEIGMIQVVLNSATTANINYEAGGAMQVLAKETLKNWLMKHNPGDAFERAQSNFLYSCAAYCVATYVLGIGDRHNDNIMMTKAGHLFHIDFGHFLGNFKKKYGFKRERSPFIFTPQYSCVLGGKKSPHFVKFVQLCGRAYNIIRKHADLFINLFLMMLSTGIPELKSVEDITYLKNALNLGKTDEEAAKIFAEQIIVALNTKTTLVNDVIHVWVHN